MRGKELRKTVACLALALVAGGAWTFHIAEVHHGVADNDCQVCAVAVSPQLNSDCGTVLLAEPLDFVRLTQEVPATAVTAAAPPVFRGRAPPAC